MTSASRVLVTGATGFIGRALVSDLLASGLPPDRLRLLVRDPRRAVGLGLPPASLCAGDLTEPGSLRAAARGATLVYHLAGAIKALARAELFAVNAEGTAAVVEALGAGAAGCRLVHVSSLAAAGPSVDGAGSALPAEQCRPCSDYGESKRQGELRVAAAGARLRWIVIRPPLVYGPGDASTRLLFRQAGLPLVAVPWTRCPLSLIHVKDLVKVLQLAAESELCGRALPVEGPDRLDTHALAHLLAAALGRRARLLRVPLVTLGPVALGADLLSRLRRRASLLSRDKLRELRACGWVADGSDARRLLRFAPAIAAADGLAATARAEGLR